MSSLHTAVSRQTIWACPLASLSPAWSPSQTPLDTIRQPHPSPTASGRAGYASPLRSSRCLGIRLARRSVLRPHLDIPAICQPTQHPSLLAPYQQLGLAAGAAPVTIPHASHTHIDLTGFKNLPGLSSTKGSLPHPSALAPPHQITIPCATS